MAIRNWDNTNPPSTQKFKLGATRITELKVDIDERETVDRYWSVDKAYDGESKKTTYRDQASAPAAVSSKSFVFAKNDGAYSLLYMEDGQGNVSSLGMPVGSIVAWAPGYFTNGSNAGYTAVAINLPSNWKECDGSALNDSASPIWNAAGRYLPNLTDDRFLMGDVAASCGGKGGSNSLAHTHVFTQPVFTVPSHNHKWYTESALSSDYSYDTNGNPRDLTLASDAYLGIQGSAAVITKIDDQYYTNNTSLTLTRTVDGAVGAATITENRPLFLSVRYIIKVK